MKRTKVMGILLACALLVGGICPSAAKGKTILIPEKQKKENRFGQTDGNFSYEYKAESENLVLFWEKSFGKNPE